jgi:parvulin-like peptidyl-prolyl isomerase
MMRLSLLALVAMAFGIGAAEYLTTSFSFRRSIGHVVRRGELQALVGCRGIYDTDVERAWRAELFAIGADTQDIATSTATKQKRLDLQRLIEREKLNAAASGQSINSASVVREMDLLHAQFRDEKSWDSALSNAGIAHRALEREVASDLRDRAWIETEIAPELPPNEREARRFFEEHRADFQEPLRLRASHLFLAAPEGCLPEVIEAKRALIAELAKRLASGESFSALVAEFSEDDATKKRDGDLGYFAEKRMLPAVFAAARQLQPGTMSAPVHSQLGFHLLRLTESLSARALTFEEARPEIDALLANRKRTQAVATVVAALR